MKQRIALIGLSGSGKTTVGKLVADKLGWRFVDTDHEIEQQTGHATQQLFVEWGESAFRAKEREVLGQALHAPNTVVATDGGMVEDAANRDLLGSSAFNVWLHAPAAVLVERLRALSDQAPPARFTHLQQRRAPFYTALADWMVATHVRTPHEVADDIVDGYRRSQQKHDDTLRVTTPGGSYPIYLNAGALDELPQRLQEAGVGGGRLWLISDEQVLPLHGERVRNTLKNAERTVQSFAIGAGEGHKTLQTVEQVYDWLLRNGVERGDAVLALGGGVVGDLAGFVAATVLRGIAFVQLPTNVLSMVDSAIGGKTGVDHAVGKNLIGAFWQPRLVLSDTTLLQTLPPRERVAGWAEAIKHGVIGDKELFAALGQHSKALLNGEEPVTSDLLRRAAAFKARIVSGDEREQGERILLNYGHTVGHAIEAESNYTLRHGEAVAIGMMAAGTLANAFGLFPDSELAEQRALLQAFGLPTCVPAGMNIQNILQRITSDKKTRNARVRWVLPRGIGKMIVRDNVPHNVVEVVLSELQEQDHSVTARS
jgi:3-dehydroquinate synthase